LRCKVYIVFGKTDLTNKDPYRQQSAMIVPADVPGITVKRVLSVVGYDHAPEGHAHISFHNVHVPKTDIILGEGRGFEIVQGRLGPGRIHHAMRSIGAVRFPIRW
jgi:acyl-CoA dehydrogenase